MVFNFGIGVKSEDTEFDKDQFITQAGSGTSLQRQTGVTQAGQQTQATQTSASQQDTNQFLLTLPPEVQEAVASLIQEQTGGAGAPGVTPGAVGTAEAGLAFAGDVGARALGVSEDFDARVAPILASAEAANQRRLEEIGTNLATQAGSGLNTLASLGIAESGIQLDTELAALAGQLGLEGIRAEETAIANAIDAFTRAPQVSAGVSAAGRAPANEASANIANLVNSIRGATQVGSSTTTDVGQVQTDQTVLTQQLQDVFTAFTQFANQFSETNVTGSQDADTVSGEFGFGI